MWIFDGNCPKATQQSHFHFWCNCSNEVGTCVNLPHKRLWGFSPACAVKVWEAGGWAAQQSSIIQRVAVTLSQMVLISEALCCAAAAAVAHRHHYTPENTPLLSVQERINTRGEERLWYHSFLTVTIYKGQRNSKFIFDVLLGQQMWSLSLKRTLCFPSFECVFW